MSLYDTGAGGMSPMSPHAGGPSSYVRHTWLQLLLLNAALAVCETPCRGNRARFLSPAHPRP
jgi:hypothetical protein